MFDVLTYEKGASVLRMIEQYLGPEVFRAGVRSYLHEHEFANAETGDLWAALGEASGQDVPQVLNAWVFRPGYPLVCARLEDGNRLVLRQQRFTYLPLKDGAGGEHWHIPIQLRVTADGKTATHRLLLKEEAGGLELPGDFASVLVNESGHGFYRVRYAPELLERLLHTGLEALAAIERFNLVNDAWAAVLAGLMPLTAYLDLTGRFRTERDKNVWAVLTGSFQTLNRILDPADRPRLEAFVRDRVGPLAAALGDPQPGEVELVRQLRGDLLRTLGTLGNDAETQRRAAGWYAQYLQGQTAVDANVLAAAIPVLAFAGDEARYEEFRRRFRSASTPQEEQRFLYSLAAFRPPELLARTLAGTLDGTFRTQDAPFVVRALLTSVYGRERAWDFVRENWERMAKNYPETGLRRMCEGVTGLATPDWERDVRRFFAERKIDLGGKTLEQYLEQLRIVVALREREGANLHEYLARFG
jgi:puromycin-sensitive aminopeptidase